MTDTPFLGITYENCSYEDLDAPAIDRLFDAVVESSSDEVQQKWKAMNLALDFWESQPTGKRNDTAYFTAFHAFEAAARRDLVIRRKLGVQ